MKVYPLYEIEIKALSLFNGVAATCFGLGSALLGFGTSVYASGVIQGTLTPEASTFVRFVCPFSILLGTIVMGVGCWSWHTGISERQRIMNETAQEEDAVPTT